MIKLFTSITTRQKHWLFFSLTALGAIAVVNVFIFILWLDMTDEERTFGAQIFQRVVIYGTLAIGVLLIVSSQFILYIFNNYISPIEKLTEETRLISVANAKYRIKPSGAMETTNLTTVINELADSYLELKTDVKKIMSESSQGFEIQKKRLDTLMHQTDQGVIICNYNGRILSFNSQASLICSTNTEKNHESGFLGKGRSIFGLLKRDALVIALHKLQKKIVDNLPNPKTEYITVRNNQQFLRCSISAVIIEVNKNTLESYILVIEDITRNIIDNHSNNQPQERIQKTVNDKFILSSEFFSTCKHLIKRQLNIEVQLHDKKVIWINMNCYPLIDLIVHIINRFTLNQVHLSISETDGNYYLQLMCNYKSFEINDIQTWINQYFKDRLYLSQLWETKNDVLLEEFEEDSILKFKIEAKKTELIEPNYISNLSKPLHYDFDLFNAKTKSSVLGNRLLRELPFVVFDTETTGLNPQDGDEIISIAAIRIYDGEIQEEETFDHLIDPKRNIPMESLLIHGIHPQMLANKPSINEVLPRFYEFAENAVLVAHNASFDFKFLQLKEKESKVVFNNPILDTLMLSSLCHPSQELHNLEDIAAKCGVDIIGRHTALGDAIVTAKIFLKLIPILEANGIKTLKDAIEMSKETKFASLKF